MKDVTFGQYYPVDSPVHRLDPRLKIVFLIGYIVAIFVASNFYGLIACAAVLLLTVMLSKVPLKKVLRSVKGVLFILLFTAFLNMFFSSGETVYAEWWIFKISKEGLIFAAFLAIRLFLLVMFSSMLTYTTAPVALTDGIEGLFAPFKFMRGGVHVCALIMSIALRFIPTLMDETDRIMNAQKARGADFESGSIAKRVKAIVPILIPLLISAFRRAEELGDAMDARCYMGSKNRTKYKKLRFGWGDLVAFLILAALLAAVIVMKIYLGAVV